MKTRDFRKHEKAELPNPTLLFMHKIGRNTKKPAKHLQMYKRTLLAMSSSFMKDKMWNHWNWNKEQNRCYRSYWSSTVHHYGTRSYVKRWSVMNCLYVSQHLSWQWTEMLLNLVYLNIKQFQLPTDKILSWMQHAIGSLFLACAATWSCCQCYNAELLLLIHIVSK